MARSPQWIQAQRSMRPVAPPDAERQAIVAVCDAFISDVLKPRFLPAIRPTEWNYVVDIHGKWAGGRYRFIQRYRSGRADNLGEEFDSPFTRLNRVGPNRFDVYWMRATGKWWRLYAGQSLKEALQQIESDELLHPL